MKQPQMLHEMCRDILTAVDIKAMCKSRGFSEKEVNSRSLLENAFLSPIGVEDALKTLTLPEVTTLHLLHMEDRVVDVTFFERLYGTEREAWRMHGTVTQLFRPVYEAVQRNLVRKGVLIVAAARTSATDKAKIELWRYRFPPEFGRFLPSLFTSSVRSAQPGHARTDGLRAELSRLARGADSTPHMSSVCLDADGLTIGNKPFSVAAVREWRESRWDAAIATAARGDKGYVQGYYAPNMHTGYLLPGTEYRKPSPLPAVSYALARLAADEWIAPGQLDTLLAIAYGDKRHPAATTICQAGWENRCLVRLDHEGRHFYRPAGAEPAAGSAPDRFLSVADGRVDVDVQNIPFAALEALNRMAALAVEGGRLRAVPSMAKMAEARETCRDDDVLRFLRTHSPAFRAQLETIDVQWGRLIIHENLLVARVADLSLRVKLLQAFGGPDGAPSSRLVALTGDYIAFPRALLGDIDKLLKKSGHVVRTVQPT